MRNVLGFAITANGTYMWQSRVEIEHYSILAQFNMLVFEVEPKGTLFLLWQTQSAVTQYFHYGRGSYALCKLMNT